DATLRRALAERHLAMTPSLGFADGYALAARPEIAARLHVARISDLAAHPELRLGFSEEFLARGDGWPALRARYRLPQTDVRGLARRRRAPPRPPHRRAPDAGRAVGRRRDPPRRAARHRRRAPPPPAPAHPRHDGPSADDPVAGAPGLHDPDLRDRHRTGAGR